MGFLRRNANAGHVAVSIVVAILLGAATITAGFAAEAWQSATREEIKWSAAAIEDVRYVYLDLAPDAFAIAESRNRADQLENYAAGTDLDFFTSLDRVFSEARAAQRTAEETAFALAESNSLLDAAYVLPEGGYDIPTHLGAVRAETVVQASAQNLLDLGDRLNVLTQVLALLCVPIVLLWVFVQAVAHTLDRSRDTDPVAEDQPDHETVDIMPQPWFVSAPLRGLAYASLTAWILLTLMPVAILGMSAAAQRADADSSRLAVSTTTGLTASSLQFSLAATQLKKSSQLSFGAFSRGDEALGSGDESEFQLAQAEILAADEWVTVTQPMTRVPTTQDGVDAPLVNALSATLGELDEMRLDQNAAAERAGRIGNAVNVATLSIALAALSASMLAFALVVKRTHRVVRIGGMVLVCGAVLASAASLVLVV